MKRHCVSLVLAIGLGLVLNGVAVAKDVLLRFAPENKELHYTMKVQQEVFVQGFEMESNFEGEIDLVWLEMTKDGKAKLSITFRNIEGTMRRGDDLTDQDLGINNTEVWVTVSERGEVDDVAPQAVLDEARTSMVQNFVEDLVLFMPENEVSEGDSWVQQRDREGATPDDPPALKGQVEYWLDGLEKKDGLQVAKVVGEGKATINMATPGGMLVGEAKGDVEYRIALDGGYLIKGKSFTEVKGEIGSGQEISQVRRFECELKK
jgi:hypothetical protein